MVIICLRWVLLHQVEEFYLGLGDIKVYIPINYRSEINIKNL